jgi:phosphate starvation-inducible PhoH-like protein
VEFDDNALLPRLYGDYDRNLARIEQRLGISLATRGNRVAITGPGLESAIARDALTTLYDRLRRGLEVNMGEVDAAIRLADAERQGAPRGKDEPVVVTPKRHITARSARQRDYINALRESELVFGLGPAGTGKTYLAVAIAVSMMMSGQVDRIILSRPAVEAGERLGFLPGDVRDKVDPYLRPLYDALHDMLPADQVIKRLNSGEIEIAPLAFMRGRTLSNAFVILDEGQNTTKVQMKMFLTRLGEHSRMAVTGDLSQVDLPRGEMSGLQHAIHTLDGMKGLAQITFTDSDVVRHELVTRIVRAYDEEERRVAAKRPRK